MPRAKAIPRWNPSKGPSVVKAMLESARWIRGRGADFALAGGLAVRTYGHLRETIDVDWIVWSGQEEVLCDALAARPVGSVKSLTFGGARAVKGFGAPVDFISRDDRWTKLYDDALEAAKKADPINVKDALIHVVPLEYLVAMKMATERTKDKADVVALLRLAPVDRAKLARILTKHRVEDWQQELKLYELEAERERVEREGKD